MPGLLGVVQVLGAVVGLLVLSLLLLALRQRWLARQGGTFACSLRLHTSDDGGGWALGVARYNQGQLEWFRFFSYAPRPRLIMPRDDVRVLETRDPNLVEAVALGADQRVLRVEAGIDGQSQDRELAMSPESMTGLLSWLEAAPPGVRRVD